MKTEDNRWIKTRYISFIIHTFLEKTSRYTTLIGTFQHLRKLKTKDVLNMYVKSLMNLTSLDQNFSVYNIVSHVSWSSFNLANCKLYATGGPYSGDADIELTMSKARVIQPDTHILECLSL
jgi:hypothetical protein